MSYILVRSLPDFPWPFDELTVDPPVFTCGCSCRTEPSDDERKALSIGSWLPALFKRDGTYQHRASPPLVYDRYAMGLEEGQVLIRPGWVDCLWHPTAKGTRV